MSLLFPDKVSITPITINTNYGTETEGAAFTSRAYVEEESKILYSSSGQPMDPVMYIYMPWETNIAAGYYIQITQLHGATPTAGEGVKRKVQRVSRVGGSQKSHIEVIV